MPRNIGTLGAMIAGVLLLGHCMSSGVPFLAYWAWKLIGLLVALFMAIAVFLFVGNYYESATLAWVASAVVMAVSVIIVGAIV